MKRTELIMGMPVTLEIALVKEADPFDQVFAYFKDVDERFSPYKKTSELSLLNDGKLKEPDYSADMREVLELCSETKRISGGFFDIVKSNGRLDPSGLVKGWAINHAANLLRSMGYDNFCLEAGGDIQTSGQNEDGHPWSIGIRNPFNIEQIVKVVELSDRAIATSGTYIRGEHIYNPLAGYVRPAGIKSLSVIGLNIFEADRFATAAFAMGPDEGLAFISALPEMQAYLIGDDQSVTFTKGFEAYVA